ncbi:twin-arginine translocation signal domain-containing protein [Massilia norwichensis]|uniref:Twin-arginine translocation signal domain-containing protein n=1 Tax=Massilia norwichensis TaxID=1442366 RepID=A0ABT2A786_9BURK|nr:twin-arginine translocation signal domain-containing protein [Massilia norwichensis]MCS0590042.1 twin-arginine translocation signal domain-containing protein [Massilia norwichensis]
METSRRSFLKAGALAALVLAAGGGIYRATHPPAPKGFVLDGEARDAMHAIVPAILAGVLPTEAQARQQAIGSVTERLHQTILGLPLATQQEVQDLFGLLALGPARRLLTGIPHGWTEATDAEVTDWLQDWRTHRLALLRTAYQALHDLVLGSWYSDAANWAAIGYPGPLKELA